MKPILICLILAGSVFAGSKADQVAKLNGIRQEILDRQREEFDKKYVESLEKLLKQAPTSNESDQLAVKKEIYQTKFIGKYHSKNNPPYHISILENGLAVHDDEIGRWEIKERLDVKDGTQFIHVYIGPLEFIFLADQTKDYKGMVRVKGVKEEEESFIRR